MLKQIVSLSFIFFGLVSGSDIFDRFKTWASSHQISFKDNSHLSHIFSNWVENDNYIQNINSQNLTWTAGHNAFTGMNLDEYKLYMGLDVLNEFTVMNLDQFNVIKESSDYDLSTLPTSWDWRAKGVVSPIRDQGQCGSCWAFSGTSTIESAVAIKTGVLNDLSEQQGVDCSTISQGWKNMGCNGGWYYNLWDYVKSNGGLTSETCYPYTSGVTKSTGTCKKTCSSVSNTKVIGQVVITPGSDSAMMNGLYINPVSVAI
jgi:C1A family cysteine protease